MAPARGILIVGGGIAGLSAAIALGERGMKTEIVEVPGIHWEQQSGSTAGR